MNGITMGTVDCATCGAARSVVMGYPGPCMVCYAKLQDETKAAEQTAAAEMAAGRVRRAVESWTEAMPARFRWAMEPTDAERARVPAKFLEAMARAPTPRTLALLGKAGAGKSSAAAMLVTQWARAGVHCAWISASTIDEHARSMRLGEEMPASLKRARKVAVLVLDDVGGTEGTIGNEELGRLMHSRHDADLVTVSTSGLSPEQISARYGAGIARRLLESGVVRL